MYKNTEELFFSYWLEELEYLGYIDGFSYESQSFELTPKVTYKYQKQLKTKIKTIEKTLFQPMTYTPDFIIYPNIKGVDIFGPPHQQKLLTTSGNSEICFVDVKGQFAGKTNSTQYTFPLKQKFMWSKHRIYVQKVVTFDLFKKTFVPRQAIQEHRYKKDCKHGKKGEIKFKFPVISLDNWLKTL